MPLVTCTAMIWKWWGHGFVSFEEEITIKRCILSVSASCSKYLLCQNITSCLTHIFLNKCKSPHFYCAFHLTKLNYDIISVRHRRVVGMKTKREEISALGDSAYLLVCRRHATLLALCNTHSGWGGAGSVCVVLRVASCTSAAAAQHITTLDDIAAGCATIGACPIACPIGGAPCGHYCCPSTCCTGWLGYKHGHSPCCASSHWDS